MEEEIKILEELFGDFKEDERVIFSQRGLRKEKEFKAIENLINRNKELEEAIEILRNECINTYAERKALAIQTVLNLIEKQKAEIEDWKMEYNHWCQLAIDRAKEIETLKRDFEIVDHECSRLEQEDIRKDMIINEMAKQLADYKYEELICMEIDCRHTEIQNEGKCIGDTNCIKEYFENKVKESK